jgi:hypothetical protein
MKYNKEQEKNWYTKGKEKRISSNTEEGMRDSIDRRKSGTVERR